MQPFDVLVLVIGILLVLRAILSSIRTFVLPRAANDLIARMVFRSVRRVFDLVIGPMKSYRRRDRVMSYFGPVALMTLPVAWLITVGIGYAFIFWAVGIHPLGQAIVDSGSSLLTLGFERPAALAGELIAFSEAVIGLGMVALLIAYLPTIYAAFSRRELLVTLLETRADSPPSPVMLLTRLHRIHGLDDLHDLWERWEEWFAELEETHTSLTVLVHFRSQQPERSWVNAAGAVLDAAALVRSSVAIPIDPRADLMIRAGYLALRRITDGLPPSVRCRAHAGERDADRPSDLRDGARRARRLGRAAGRGSRGGLARFPRLASELRRAAPAPRGPHRGDAAMVDPADPLRAGDRRPIRGIGLTRLGSACEQQSAERAREPCLVCIG